MIDQGFFDMELAIVKEINKEYIESVKCYEREIANNDSSVLPDSYINLAFLYWSFAFEFLEFMLPNSIPEDYSIIGVERYQMIIELGLINYPNNAELHFWKKYFQHIIYGDIFTAEDCKKLVEKYEQDGIMPVYENEWEEKYRKSELEETIIGLYEVQPKLFASLNIDPKKTFVRLLDLLLDSNERENLFKIINEVVELEPEEREDLANLFKTTKLNRIIETIKLIEDRSKTFYILKDLLFNPDLKAN